MKGISTTHITWRFVQYHSIPFVETRSTRKKYNSIEKAKEVNKLRSERWRERNPDYQASYRAKKLSA